MEVQNLYAPDGLSDLCPVRPDLLGEHIVIDAVSSGDDLLVRFFDSPRTDHVTCLLVMNRCMEDRHGLPVVAKATRSLARALPARMGMLAPAVARAALAGAEKLVGTETSPGLIEKLIDLLDENGFKSLRDAGPLHSERLLFARRLSAASAIMASVSRCTISIPEMVRLVTPASDDVWRTRSSTADAGNALPCAS